MIPTGGNNGWATEVISTVLLYPRQNDRNLELALTRKTLVNTVVYAAITVADEIEVADLEGNLIERLSAEDALCVDVCFDQLDRHFVVWELPDSRIFMRWYDPNTSAYLTTLIAEGNNPCCQLDDYRDRFIANSDIFLFYQRGDRIFYRSQRDRYLVEYEVPHQLQDIKLETCGMGSNLRFTLRVTSIDSIILCAGQTPIRVENNYVGLNWGEIPWAKSSSNTET
jgi:hypothetical protein